MSELVSDLVMKWVQEQERVANHGRPFTIPSPRGDGG
jgi:hypothetical protein